MSNNVKTGKPVHPAGLLSGLFKPRQHSDRKVTDMRLKAEKFTKDVGFKIRNAMKQLPEYPEELNSMVNLFVEQVMLAEDSFEKSVWKWATTQPGYTDDSLVERAEALVMELVLEKKPRYEESRKLAQLVNAVKEGKPAAVSKLQELMDTLEA
jgi:hypothetical protein